MHRRPGVGWALMGASGFTSRHIECHHRSTDSDRQPLAKEFLQQAQQVYGRGVDPHFVFNGNSTPENRRPTLHEQSAGLAKAFLQGGNPGQDPWVLRVPVKLGSPAISAVIIQLRKAGMPYVIAPNEADSQLTLFLKENAVWAVTLAWPVAFPFQ
eukprot:CAMPEP_0117660736 /NCGR_PEP_ID=MMETSP0804-20121206/7125_1 /TAXON_ID=1074897 /ORGANISM="Tetraselmis astigmatica, Strain CCMP880" /LENGTH=154 /DNA_ID=CAMNT_0005467481 /DNA_START=81 /DNA_END=545 /DNA_ORIENTATION=-